MNKSYSIKDKNFKSDNYNNNRYRNQFALPEISLLAQYEELYKGSADRIIEMIEIEQIHRQEFENNSLRLRYKNKNLEVIINLLLSIFLIYSAMYFLSKDEDFAAYVLIIMSTITIIINNVISTISNVLRRFFIKNRKKDYKYKTSSKKHEHQFKE